jgi:hypothetical protein
MSYYVCTCDIYPQRQPQAVVPITADFSYNIRDTYMSFPDAQGNSWSMMFESNEVLETYLKAVVAVRAHVTCFWDAAGSTAPPIVAQLPCPHTSSQPAGPLDSTPFAPGSTAGVSYKVFELAQASSDCAADNLTQPPFKQVGPQEMARIS